MLVRAVSNPATWLDRTDQDELHKNRRNAMLYELEQQQRSAAEKVRVPQMKSVGRLFGQSFFGGSCIECAEQVQFATRVL